MEYLEITWEQFVEEYEPIKNYLDDNASYDGFMFETYGEEYEAVRHYEFNHIWTVLDVDGELIIGSGHHWVNRMGYLVTKKPVPTNTDITVDDA